MNKEKPTPKTYQPKIGNAIPDDVIDSLARCILPSIQAYFESEKGQREFAAWKAEKAKNEQLDKGCAKEVR